MAVIFPLYTAGDGIQESGYEFSLDLASGGGLEIASSELQLASQLPSLIPSRPVCISPEKSNHPRAHPPSPH